MLQLNCLLCHDVHEQSEQEFVKKGLNTVYTTFEKHKKLYFHVKNLIN